MENNNPNELIPYDIDTVPMVAEKDQSSKKKKLRFVTILIGIFLLLAIIFPSGFILIQSSNVLITSPIPSSIINPSPIKKTNSSEKIYDDNRYTIFNMVFSPNLNEYVIATIDTESDKKSICKIHTATSKREFPCADKIEQLQITNSGQYAYVLTEKERKTLTVNGKEIGKYNSVENLQFSSNGNKFGYQAETTTGEKTFFINGGSDFETDCTEILNYSIFFEKSITFLCQDGNTTYLTTNGQRTILSTDKNITVYLSIFFSSDGKRLAYLKKYKNLENPLPEGLENTDGPVSITIDGIESEKYGSISNVLFTEDGKHVLYLVSTLDDRKKPVQYIVFDGKIQQTTELVNGERIIKVFIIPKTFTIAYIKQNGEGQNELFINNESQGVVKNISNVVFSNDGKHYAFLSGEERKDNMSPYPLKSIYIDGKFRKTAIVTSSLIFEEDALVYYDLRQNEVWLNHLAY